MADVPAHIGDPPLEPPPPSRRLWERFSLTVLGLLLLILAEAAFGILFNDYRRTFELSPGPLIAYLAFALLAGFAIGMALVLPQKLALRHSRRALTLGLLPLLITVLNVVFALAPTALPDAIGEFTFAFLFGIRTYALLLLGMAGASAFSER